MTVPGSIPGGLCHLGFLVAPGACWRPATAALLCRAHVTGPRGHVKVRVNLAFWSQDAVLVPSLGGTVPRCHDLASPGQPALLWWDKGSCSARLLQASSPCLCTDAELLSKSSAFTSGSRLLYPPSWLILQPRLPVALEGSGLPVLQSASQLRADASPWQCSPAQARGGLLPLPAGGTPYTMSPLSFDTRPPQLRDGNSSFPTARVQIQNQFLKLEFNCFTILC